jgi:hypothetical protein
MLKPSESYEIKVDSAEEAEETDGSGKWEDSSEYSHGLN